MDILLEQYLIHKQYLASCTVTKINNPLLDNLILKPMPANHINYTFHNNSCVKHAAQGVQNMASASILYFKLVGKMFGTW